MDQMQRAPERGGYEALWAWFGLSRSSWLTLPRTLMHDMPDDWQRDMARLLEQWDDTWRGDTAAVVATTKVMRVGKRGRFASWPEWVVNYRYPDTAAIAAAKRPPPRIALAVGDPRRAAWLKHLRRSGEADVASHYERSRLQFEADADWPPESADVTASGLGLFQIPWGTPEHDAWLASWRRQGGVALLKAQSTDVSCRTLMQRSRWPALNGEGV